MIKRNGASRALVLFLCSVFGVDAAAQAQPPVVPAQNEQQRRLEFEEARARAAEKRSFLAREKPVAIGPLVFPSEVPCFRIHEIEWRGVEAFPWLRGRLPIEGNCLGSQGLQLAKMAVALELRAEGYVTTRVAVPEQDLSQGRLTLEIIAGRIGKIRDADGSIGWPRSVFPVAEGDLLNVRDLEQALENVRRLPGQRNTKFDLVPGEEPGSFDIVFVHPQNATRVRGALTVGNSGVDATGRNQVDGAVSIDSPLGLYDQLIVTFGSGPYLHKRPRSSVSKSIAWNVPIGRASFFLGASEWVAKQPLEIQDLKIPYATRTRRHEAGLGYVPYRSSSGKGMLRFTLFRRQESAWIADEALDIQRRDITGFEIGAGHLEKVGRATVELGVAMRGSLPGESKFPGYVLGQSDWNGRYRIATANVSADVPFEIGDRSFGYRGSWLLQHAPRPIPSVEYLQLGGRQTVRGFDGNRTLSAPSGWLWRNEVAMSVLAGSEAYLALDVGAVSGGNTHRRRQTLAGAALGVRGNYKQFGYDLSLGTPLVKPESVGRQKPFLNFLFTTSF